MGSLPCSQCRMERLPSCLREKCKEVNPGERGRPTPIAGWCLQRPGCCCSCLLSQAPGQWPPLAPPSPSSSSIGRGSEGALQSTASDTIPTLTLSSLSWFRFLLSFFLVNLYLKMKVYSYKERCSYCPSHTLSRFLSIFSSPNLSSLQR